MPYQFDVKASRQFLGLVEDKWQILILDAVFQLNGRARFNAIRRNVDGISQKMLTQCLRKLERNGIFNRSVLVDARPIAVEYSLSDLGHSMFDPLRVMHEWIGSNYPKVEEARRCFDTEHRSNE